MPQVTFAPAALLEFLRPKHPVAAVIVKSVQVFGQPAFTACSTRPNKSKTFVPKTSSIPDRSRTKRL